MTPKKSLELSCGGKLTYRLPNCIEQLRFYVDSKWNSKTLMLEQIESAVEHIEPFVVEIDSEKYETFDDILQDRSNVNTITELALDIANQTLPESKKK